MTLRWGNGSGSSLRWRKILGSYGVNVGLVLVSEALGTLHVQDGVEVQDGVTDETKILWSHGRGPMD